MSNSSAGIAFITAHRRADGKLPIPCSKPCHHHPPRLIDRSGHFWDDRCRHHSIRNDVERFAPLNGAVENPGVEVDLFKRCRHG